MSVEFEGESEVAIQFSCNSILNHIRIAHSMTESPKLSTLSWNRCLDVSRVKKQAAIAHQIGIGEWKMMQGLEDGNFYRKRSKEFEHDSGFREERDLVSQKFVEDRAQSEPCRARDTNIPFEHQAWLIKTDISQLRGPCPYLD